jgi:hypothetical protein
MASIRAVGGGRDRRARRRRGRSCACSVEWRLVELLEQLLDDNPDQFVEQPVDDNSVARFGPVEFAQCTSLGQLPEHVTISATRR